MAQADKFPALNPETFAPQLIWLAIIFVLFYFALSRLALPRIEKVLKDRKAKIGGDIQAARDAQHHADKEAERYEAEIAAAKAKGHTTIRAAREKLEAELGEKRRDLDAQLAEKTAETEKNVKTFLERAAGEMESITASVVSDIVKELAGVEVNENEVRTALRQSSKE
jgi:F-type H+-transporting ATPase subunit b